jgi:hypothetical protein
MTEEVMALRAIRNPQLILEVPLMVPPTSITQVYRSLTWKIPGTLLKPPFNELIIRY